MAVQLAVADRQRLGKKVRALRRAGLIPANIVCKDKPSLAIEIADLKLQKAIQAAGYTQPLQLEFEDKQPLTVLITDIKFHPAKGNLEHVSFQEVKKGQLVTAEVPIVLIGEAAGLQQGLILIQTMYSIEVEAGALSLPESLEVDVSQLEDNGSAVRVEAITLPEGVTISADQEEPIARLEMPRVQVAQEAQEAADQEAAEAEAAAAEAESAESDSDSEEAETV